MSPNSQKVLVAGGAGFLGSHLCEYLLGIGHIVLCLDNFQTGNLANIRHLMDNPRFDLIHHDVLEPIVVDVQQIYNLACPASPRHYQRDPVSTTKTNVLGALNLLSLAKSSGARILQASTSEVYGDPDEHPQKESYWGRVNPNGVRSCYDEGKRCAESLFLDYSRHHDVDVKIARIFNTYGPRMHPDDGRVVSNFIVQALEGKQITLFGDGEQTRSFCFVDDMIQGLVRLMGSEKGIVGPINLGNPHEITVRELAEDILQLTGLRVNLVLKPLPEDDPRRRCPDISLAKSLLGWEPTTTLQNGLRITVKYFREQLTNEFQDY